MEIESWINLSSILWLGGFFIMISQHVYFANASLFRWLSFISVHKIWISFSTVLIGTALFLVINFIFPTESSQTEVFEVVHFKKKDNVGFIVFLENDAYSNKEYFRTLSTANYPPKLYAIETQRGLMGFPVFKGAGKAVYLNE
jgi:hypothetical protein